MIFFLIGKLTNHNAPLLVLVLVLVLMMLTLLLFNHLRPPPMIITDRTLQIFLFPTTHITKGRNTRIQRGTTIRCMYPPAQRRPLMLCDNLENLSLTIYISLINTTSRSYLLSLNCPTYLSFPCLENAGSKVLWSWTWLFMIVTAAIAASLAALKLNGCYIIPALSILLLLFICFLVSSFLPSFLQPYASFVLSSNIL